MDLTGKVAFPSAHVTPRSVIQRSVNSAPESSGHFLSSELSPGAKAAKEVKGGRTRRGGIVERNWQEI